MSKAKMFGKLLKALGKSETADDAIKHAEAERVIREAANEMREQFEINKLKDKYPDYDFNDVKTLPKNPMKPMTPEDQVIFDEVTDPLEALLKRSEEVTDPISPLPEEVKSRVMDKLKKKKN